MAENRGPLHGIRVVEVGQLLAGPFCGHLFSDYGADVIKIEAPGEGDQMRRWAGMYKGLGMYWPLLSREKKSVTLNLREAEGQTLLRELVKTADVLLENFRPGTMEKWGLGWQQVRELNPRATMIRVTGYGQTGPYRDKTGFGSIGEAMSGFRHLSGEPRRAPVRVGISIGDALAGTYGFIGGMMSLYNRDRPNGSGTGQQVDVGLYEAMWVYMESILPEYEKLGQVRQPTGALIPSAVPSNVYPTSDGVWLVIGANQDNIFKRLSEGIGKPDWAADGSPYQKHLGRVQHQAEIDGAIAEWTSVRTADEVLRVMDEVAVPAGRIYSAADIATDPHYAAREMIVSIPEPGLNGEQVRMQGIVPKLSETPARVTRGGPLLGEHDTEILSQWLSPEQLKDYAARGVI